MESWPGGSLQHPQRMPKYWNIFLLTAAYDDVVCHPTRQALYTYNARQVG